MKKSNKIYIIGICYDDDKNIRHVYPKAYRNWFNAVKVADSYQMHLNRENAGKSRHTVVIGVRPDYVNNKIEGSTIHRICGHHYDDTEWQ